MTGKFKPRIATYIIINKHFIKGKSHIEEAQSVGGIVTVKRTILVWHFWREDHYKYTHDYHLIGLLSEKQWLETFKKKKKNTHGASSKNQILTMTGLTFFMEMNKAPEISATALCETAKAVVRRKNHFVHITHEENKKRTGIRESVRTEDQRAIRHVLHELRWSNTIWIQEPQQITNKTKHCISQ